MGFISLKEHNRYTEEIYVLGVLKKYYRQGIGKELLARAAGFYPMMELNEIWDEDNPCLIMVKSL